MKKNTKKLLDKYMNLLIRYINVVCERDQLLKDKIQLEKEMDILAARIEHLEV